MKTGISFLVLKSNVAPLNNLILQEDIEESLGGDGVGQPSWLLYIELFSVCFGSQYLLGLFEQVVIHLPQLVQFGGLQFDLLLEICDLELESRNLVIEFVPDVAQLKLEVALSK